jgi:hypothetical protein
MLTRVQSCRMKRREALAPAPTPIGGGGGMMAGCKRGYLRSHCGEDDEEITESFRESFVRSRGADCSRGRCTRELTAHQGSERALGGAKQPFS